MACRPMRLLAILLISVALATTAGCFGKSKEPTPTPATGGGTTTPTPTTGGGGTTTTPTPTMTPTTGTGGNTTTPPKPAPKQLCTVSFDASTNQPTPPATTASKTADCGSVTAGYTKAALSGNFSAKTPAPVNLNQGVKVSLVDSTGAVVATCTGPSPGPMQAAVECPPAEGAVKVGVYSMLFEGFGDIQFDGVVMIS